MRARTTAPRKAALGGLAALACLALALLAAGPAGAAGGGGVSPGGGGDQGVDEQGGGDQGGGRPKYVQVPRSGPGFVHPRSSPRRCGLSTRPTLQRAKQMARRYRELAGSRLVFWDFGVRCPGHASHRRGMDADISTPALPRIGHRSRLRLAYGRVMAAAAFEAGACYAIYNDRRVRRDWPRGRAFDWPGHWDHFHIRWRHISRWDNRLCRVQPRNRAVASQRLDDAAAVLRAYHSGKKLPPRPKDKPEGDNLPATGGVGGA